VNSRAAIRLRFLALFTLLGVLGVAATLYTLIHQRVTLPFDNTYSLNLEFSAADGVVGGIGQPVNVVGVSVGQVTGVKLAGGLAVVTVQIQRQMVPHVYADATATLQPISPLGDLEVDLDPGAPPARPLLPRATVDLTRTTVPVHLSDLLSTLDADTRDYLTSLISTLSVGVGDRGGSMRRMLLALGPTVHQVGGISRALAARRTALAQFVHNLAAVTHAASRDGQVESLVTSGDETLRAIAQQDQPLRSAISQLPAAMAVTGSTLTHLTPFAHELGPTLTALLPAVRRLPATLSDLRSFASTVGPALRNEVRPFVAAAQPLVRSAGPAVTDLRDATPAITGSAQTLNYLLNELSYVPGGGDEGLLFWTDWAAHNFNSIFSTGDANGAVGRASTLQDCAGLEEAPQLQPLFGLANLCPK
jgi:phospholipid/cholesterol/gamma-HCH transport system substrate-binding protein